MLIVISTIENQRPR